VSTGGRIRSEYADFERIHVLDVVNDPLFSSGPLASVPAFERTLEGNAV
jgi:hypothetical protein